MTPFEYFTHICVTFANAVNGCRPHWLTSMAVRIGYIL